LILIGVVKIFSFVNFIKNKRKETEILITKIKPRSPNIKKDFFNIISKTIKTEKENIKKQIKRFWFLFLNNIVKLNKIKENINKKIKLKERAKKLTIIETKNKERVLKNKFSKLFFVKKDLLKYIRFFFVNSLIIENTKI